MCEPYLLAAADLPPLRPAALCWAVVPPWEASPPEPLFFPPLCAAFGEFEHTAPADVGIAISLCDLFAMARDVVEDEPLAQ